MKLCLFCINPPVNIYIYMNNELNDTYNFGLDKQLIFHRCLIFCQEIIDQWCYKKDYFKFDIDEMGPLHAIPYILKLIEVGFHYQ